jgi:RimJ/RimL family protein N-acetyltransferase
MASCYGKQTSVAPSGNEETLEKCPYLPISKIFEINGISSELELTLFTTEDDFFQGLRLMNHVIIEGKTWPFLDVFSDVESYKNYFHSHSAFAVKFKDQLTNLNEILGCFYIKPNFPGRCSHVCNGGFITNPKFRGMGIGAFMGENFKRLAKDLGYRSSLFNLVFANNAASVKLWRKLGFTQLAVIPKVAVLEGSEGYVDAYQFHCDFYPDEV